MHGACARPTTLIFLGPRPRPPSLQRLGRAGEPLRWLLARLLRPASSVPPELHTPHTSWPTPALILSPQGCTRPLCRGGAGREGEPAALAFGPAAPPCLPCASRASHASYVTARPRPHFVAPRLHAPPLPRRRRGGRRARCAGFWPGCSALPPLCLQSLTHRVRHGPPPPSFCRPKAARAPFAAEAQGGEGEPAALAFGPAACPHPLSFSSYAYGTCAGHAPSPPRLPALPRRPRAPTPPVFRYAWPHAPMPGRTRAPLPPSSVHRRSAEGYARVLFTYACPANRLSLFASRGRPLPPGKLPLPPPSPGAPYAPCDAPRPRVARRPSPWPGCARLEAAGPPPEVHPQLSRLRRRPRKPRALRPQPVWHMRAQL